MTLPREAGVAHAVAAAGSRMIVGTDGGLFELNGKGISLARVPLPGPRGAVFAVALRDSGDAAAGGAAGLLSRNGTDWVQEFPRDGSRSWAPADVRGLGFDAKQRLWFFSPQGAGVKDGSSWKLFTGAEGLPYDDATALAAGPGGEVWLGTRMGAIRYDGALLGISAGAAMATR